MIVKNPTDSTLSIQYKGIVYTIEPQSQLSVPTEVAEHWKTRIHEFVILEAEVASEIPAVVDQEMLDENPILAEMGVEVGTPVEEGDLPADAVEVVLPKKAAKAPKKAKAKSAK